MGKFNGKDATVWMRALKAHTYEGKPQDEGDIYLAHEEMVETIEILKMATREAAPPKARREPQPPPGESQTPDPAPMTTSDFTVGGVPHPSAAPPRGAPQPRKPGSK